MGNGRDERWGCLSFGKSALYLLFLVRNRLSGFFPNSCSLEYLSSYYYCREMEFLVFAVNAIHSSACFLIGGS